MDPDKYIKFCELLFSEGFEFKPIMHRRNEAVDEEIMGYRVDIGNDISFSYTIIDYCNVIDSQFIKTISHQDLHKIAKMIKRGL
jgi:hypothetical protein